MKRLLLVLLLLPLFFVMADHNIPIGTKNNHLVLSVQNELSHSLTDVIVDVESAPDWIAFSDKAVVFDSIPSSDSKEADFIFNVSDGESGQTGTVKLSIHDKERTFLRKHSIEVKTVLSLNETTLFLAYPNPSNPHTTIRYGLVEPSHVKLKIYNVLGQHVRTLLNDEKPAGQYHVLWDGTNDRGLPLASGTYIVRLETTSGGQTNYQTSKIMLKK